MLGAKGETMIRLAVFTLMLWLMPLAVLVMLVIAVTVWLLPGTNDDQELERLLCQLAAKRQ